VALSSLDDRTHAPAPAELATALGPSAPLWRQLITDAARDYPPIEEAWHFAGARFGWSLRLKRGARVVVYLIPQADCFLVGIVLGEKAVTAAHEAELPAPVHEAIDSTRAYAEGRGIRLPVSTADDLAVVLRLVALKLAG
jgi:hypothetical protein